MFSMNDDPVSPPVAIEIGAKGYVSKTGDPHDLVEAIHESDRARISASREWREQLRSRGPTLPRARFAKLTRREMEILRLLSAGKSLSEVALAPSLPYKTVATPLHHVARSLVYEPSVELVRFAIESGVA